MNQSWPLSKDDNHTYDRNHFISAFETQIVCGRHIFVIYVKITAYYFGILYLKNVVVHF